MESNPDYDERIMSGEFVFDRAAPTHHTRGGDDLFEAVSELFAAYSICANKCEGLQTPAEIYPDIETVETPEEDPTLAHRRATWYTGVSVTDMVTSIIAEYDNWCDEFAGFLRTLENEDFLIDAVGLAAEIEEAAKYRIESIARLQEREMQARDPRERANIRSAIDSVGEGVVASFERELELRGDAPVVHDWQELQQLATEKQLGDEAVELETLSASRTALLSRIATANEQITQWSSQLAEEGV